MGHSFLDFRSQGGRRAVVRTVGYSVAAVFGAMRSYRVSDWGRVRRLVFVCKGNICRSPFAEAVAARAGVESFSVGIEADPGVCADSGAIRVAETFGVDLSGHRARNAAECVLDSSDLVVGFEPIHVREIIAINQSRRGLPASQFALLGGWLRPPTLYIHDPYGADPAYFRTCFARIELAVERIAQRIGQPPTNARD